MGGGLNGFWDIRPFRFYSYIAPCQQMRPYPIHLVCGQFGPNGHGRGPQTLAARGKDQMGMIDRIYVDQ